MMPITPAQKENFDTATTNLAKENPKDPWPTIFRLYSAAASDDRAALLSAAKSLTDLPTTFPTIAAEKAHFDLLKELGLDDNQAGLEIISHRNYAPLHALLDLDRTLTKESDFLQGTTRSADAKILRDCRDRLRQAWLDNSTNLIERLFALHTLGRDPDCDALLFAARDLPYLTDPNELARTLARLDQKQAWTLIIQPLLESEIHLISSPPKLPTTTPPATTDLTIEAKNKSPQNGISTYDGNVKVTATNLQITCDKLAVIGDTPTTAKLLSGAGNITIQGPQPTPIQAENFTLNLDTGTFALSGNIRLTQNNHQQKFRAATLTRTGELRDTISLLDDFENTPDTKSRLTFLEKLTATYPDTELPPEAQYLLALSLLRPHLIWHQSPTPNDWPIEPFLREDAQQQLKPAKGTQTGTILQNQLPQSLTCTLENPTHPDVVRPKQLLTNLAGTPQAESAKRWLKELN